MALYDCKNYAQCDYVLMRKEHFHTIMDCEVRIDKATHIDHYPIYGTLKTNMKLGKKQQERHCKPKKYWKPDEERMKEYSRRIVEILWGPKSKDAKKWKTAKRRKDGRKEGRKEGQQKT